MNIPSSRVESLAALFQAARFSIVGVSNTLIDAALFFALTHSLAAPALPAKWISYGAGLANSYFWNRRWTFRAEINTARAAPLFLALNLVGLLVNAGLMMLGLNVLQLPLPVAWLAATAGALVWNFWSSKQLFVNS